MRYRNCYITRMLNNNTRNWKKIATNFHNLKFHVSNYQVNGNDLILLKKF